MVCYCVVGCANWFCCFVMFLLLGNNVVVAVCLFGGFGARFGFSLGCLLVVCGLFKLLYIGFTWWFICYMLVAL